MKPQPLTDRDFLYHEYWGCKKSLRQIGREFGCDPNTIRSNMRKRGIPIRNRGKGVKLAWRNRLVRPNLNSSPNLSYVLGVLLGDGCVGIYRKGREYRITLHTHKNPKFNSSFENALKSLGLNPHTHTVNDRDSKSGLAFDTIAYSKVFVEWYKMRTHEDIENLAKMYPCDFLRGIYESEGWFSQEFQKGKWLRERVIICNTNDKLINLCKELIESLGFNARKYEYMFPRSKRMCFQLDIGKKGEACEFLKIVSPSIKEAN